MIVRTYFFVCCMAINNPAQLPLNDHGNCACMRGNYALQLTDFIKKWWRRRELNPGPKILPLKRLHACS